MTPLSPALQEFLSRADRLAKEAEASRLAWREQRDKVSALERNYKILYEKALTSLAGEGDAHWRKAKAEAETSQAAYELELAKNLGRSMYEAHKERIEEMETLRAAIHAHNRELRELGG